MKQLSKSIKLMMVAVMGTILLSQTQNVYAESYTAASQKVTFGKTYSGGIYSTADKYRYDMYLNKAGTVTITGTLSNPDSNINYLLIKIYNKSGKCLQQKLVENSYFEMQAKLNKGNYFIVADGVMGTYGTTTFTLKPTYKQFSATSIKKLTNKATRKLKITWRKKAAISGYQVQIATNSKFTKNKKKYTVKKAAITSKTISKLKKSKNYYVRIRTYTTTLDGTKAYSKWSSKKILKITK